MVHRLQLLKELAHLAANAYDTIAIVLIDGRVHDALEIGAAVIKQRSAVVVLIVAVAGKRRSRCGGTQGVTTKVLHTDFQLFT